MTKPDRWLSGGTFTQAMQTPLTATQRERIITVLTWDRGAWVCGAGFYANYIPTFSQRISEMVAEGLPIERSTCNDPYHRHNGPIGQYRWTGASNEG